MLNEPHYPSTGKVLLVFAVLLGAIGAIFLWAFVYNRGTIIFEVQHEVTLVSSRDRLNCSDSCELSVPPNVYAFEATANGYYGAEIVVSVGRGETVRQEVALELIPYLESIDVSDLPDVSQPAFQFQDSGEQQELVDPDGNRLAVFESLVNPSVRASETEVLIVDEGRLFFVELESGRRQRRFDDTVTVQEVLISPQGKRVLLFVRHQETDQLWLWFNETNELMPLGFYELPGRIQWDPSTDHRLFVLSDQLRDPETGSVFEDLLQSIDEEPAVGLYRFNLDTSEVEQMTRFESSAPELLEVRGDRYFIRYDEEIVDELVLTRPKA